MGYDLSVRCRCCGHDHGDFNYTYNVSAMFQQAFPGGSGLSCLHGQTASAAIPMLRAAILHMEDNRVAMLQLNPPNGWGDCDSALDWLRRILVVCVDYPDDLVEVT